MSLRLPGLQLVISCGKTAISPHRLIIILVDIIIVKVREKHFYIREAAVYRKGLKTS